MLGMLGMSCTSCAKGIERMTKVTRDWKMCYRVGGCCVGDPGLFGLLLLLLVVEASKRLREQGCLKDEIMQTGQRVSPEPLGPDEQSVQED